jgi:hypothetical protein
MIFSMRKQKLPLLLVVLGLLSVPCRAEHHGKLWRVSSAILGAVTIADAHSSFGYQEMNPLLRSSNGQFAGRGFAIKGAVVGAALGVQWLLVRKNPRAAPYAAGANFAAAALTGAIVVRNHSIK